MKKVGKKVTSILALSVLAGVVGTLASCGGNSNIDSTKTQLYVKCYQGGYGNKWLYNAKERYEALHANESFEDGKKGVEILIADQKTTPASSEIKNNINEIYFFEGLNYINMVNDGAFEEITDLVTGENPYESGKTIESKMTDDVASFLNLADGNGNKHYYAVPHYASNFGLVYNKTVFRKNNYYFASGYESQEPGADSRFVLSASDKKSAGPDGIEGTADDGLPTTYDEFFELCNYIYKGKQIPFVWRGEGNAKDYFGMLLNQLSTSYDGAEQNRVNYTMDGKINVVKWNAKGDEVVFNEDGTPATEEVTVHPTKVGSSYDGYEVQRMAGKYHALDFVRRMVTDKDKWLCNIVTDSTNHTDAQNFFISSQFGRLNAHQEQKNKSIAMLMDGDWWESEASQVINELTAEERAQLDFGWMPLPRANDKAATGNTIFGDLSSFVFVKKGLSDTKKKLAGDFLQYMNTDEAYRDFTRTTNAVKYFNYDITAEDKAEMSNFGKDYWDFYKNATVVLPRSHNDQFNNGLGQQLASRRFAISDTSFYPQNNFIGDSKLTAGNYLSQVYSYYKSNIWSTLR